MAYVTTKGSCSRWRIFSTRSSRPSLVTSQTKTRISGLMMEKHGLVMSAKHLSASSYGDITAEYAGGYFAAVAPRTPYLLLGTVPTSRGSEYAIIVRSSSLKPLCIYHAISDVGELCMAYNNVSMNSGHRMRQRPPMPEPAHHLHRNLHPFAPMARAVDPSSRYAS